MRKNLLTRIASLAVAATLAITAVPATNMATVEAGNTNAPLVSQKLALTVAPKEGKAGNYYSPELRWNKDENADGYKLYITDAEGNYYGNKYDDTAEGVYVRGSSYYEGFDDISYYDAWRLNASGVWERVEDAYGNNIDLFSDGKAYNFIVKSYNATGTQVSNTVSYTVGTPKDVTKISFVRYDEEEDRFYFDQDGQRTYHSYVDYQVSEDPSFTTLASVDVHGYADYKAYIAGRDVVDGKTYYVRARLVRQNEFSEIQDWAARQAAVNAAWAAAPATSFAVTPKPVKAPTALMDVYVEITSQTSYGGYEVRFNTVLQDDEYYRVLYSTDGVNWSSTKPSMFTNDVIYAKVVTELNGSTADSNIVSIANNTKQTGTLSSLTYAEKTRSGYLFKVAGAIPAGQSVWYQWSERSDFATYDKDFTSTFKDSTTRVKDGAEFTIGFRSLNPGKKYYVRACVYNPYSTDASTRYSAYTKPVSIKAEMPKVTVSTSNIKSKSLKLVMSNVYGREYLTGYEIQQKVGKKYVAVGKTTDDGYTVKGLKANTNYTFRVRPYYYNSENGKTTNGTWTYCETMTWGSALKLQAQPSGKTKVKLSWAKVAGADGYEVYRSAAQNNSANVDKGYSDGFRADILVKNITKGSTKSYTVSGLNSDCKYYFTVKAYKTINGKKYYVSEGSWVRLDFRDFSIINQYKKSNGSVVVTWAKNYSASGFLVEKYNRTTQKWTTYKKLGKTKTTITLPAVKGNDSQQYRIRAYKGKEYSNYNTVTVYPYLGVVKDVKAKVVGEGVRVTWKAVSGASYYVVYRTTSSDMTYNKSTGSYIYDSGVSVPVYVADASRYSGYRELDEEELTTTALLDTPVKFTNARGTTSVAYVGPLKDVKYNYYVVACKKTSEGTISSLASKSAAATVKTSVPKPTLKSVKATSKKVTVSWKKVSGVKGYKIYRSTKKSSGYQLIGTAKSSKSSFVDKKAKKGTTYYYKITAYKVGGVGLDVESKASSVKKVKAK